MEIQIDLTPLSKWKEIQKIQKKKKLNRHAKQMASKLFNWETGAGENLKKSLTILQVAVSL